MGQADKRKAVVFSWHFVFATKISGDNKLVFENTCVRQFGQNFLTPPLATPPLSPVSRPALPPLLPRRWGGLLCRLARAARTIWTSSSESGSSCEKKSSTPLFTQLSRSSKRQSSNSLKNSTFTKMNPTRLSLLTFSDSASLDSIDALCSKPIWGDYSTITNFITLNAFKTSTINGFICYFKAEGRVMFWVMVSFRAQRRICEGLS